jgi:triacylglycerol lipase
MVDACGGSRSTCALKADLSLRPSLRPATGSAPIEELATQLAIFADRNLPERKFDLVGFSMGGLVSRYYCSDSVAPSEWSTSSRWRRRTMEPRWRGCTGARRSAMRPKSLFLQDLDRDADVLRQIKFTSFYTPLDTIVVPANSSVVPQARISPWSCRFTHRFCWRSGA